MKRLAIMRHAKSSWAERGLDDFDRPLNGRGRAAAEQVGHELKGRGAAFDHVLASPALRARQTLAGLAVGLDAPIPASFDARFYEADRLAWLEAIQGFAESVHAPLIVGHNPALHDLVIDLTQDDAAGRRRRLRDKFPTGALAILGLDVGSWGDVVPGCGEIVELILPRELD